MINELLHSYLPKDQFINGVINFIFLTIISIIAFYITEKVIFNLLAKMFKKTRTDIDDILIKRKVFNRLAYLVPALLLYNFSYIIPQLSHLIQKVSLSLMTMTGLMVINAFLNAISDIYGKTKYSQRIHIKSYTQTIKLIINILGIIVIIAILIGKNPTWLLSGLGAMTAVLLLIFKDTILSLVASIQINSNNLFKVGDWIEVPQFGADGDVIDIALHSVKIQNWDKTISIIPTHKLIDSALKNWKGMSDSGGRRIKRSLYIDINSIRFCTEKDLEKFTNFQLLNSYIKSKSIEITEYNKKNNIDSSAIINGRHLTNIGTFRAYIEAYLKNNGRINTDMTFLIRQLEPTSKGLPIQIYVFSNTTEWISYERIQADIFDHLLSVIPEFGLRLFQNPSGKDLNKLTRY